jgi:hypothetical protein
MKAITTGLFAFSLLTTTMPVVASAGEVTTKVTVPQVNPHIVTQSHSSGSGGGTGKVQVNDISVTKNWDSSSPKLWQRAGTGGSSSNTLRSTNSLNIGSQTSGAGSGK